MKRLRERGLSFLWMSLLGWVWLGMFPAEAFAKPDLTMDSMTLPTNARGYGSRAVVRFRVKNQGNTGANGFYVSFYYGDDVRQTSSTFLGQHWINALAAGTTSTQQSITLSLPSNVLFGKRYVHYRIDNNRSNIESDVKNNDGYRSFQVTGEANLQVLFLGASPNIQIPGGPISVSYRIYNAGYSRVPSKFRTRFYYSEDSTITTNDAYLNKEIELPSLDSQSFVPGSFASSLPLYANQGTHYIGAIVDYDKKIKESSELDNTQIAPIAVFDQKPAPDLVAVTFSVTPNRGKSGDSISFSYVITNRGNKNSSSFTVSLYRSNDPFIKNTDTLLHTFTLPALTVGQTAKATRTFVLPATTVPLTGYMGIFVDPQNVIKELSETNNTNLDNFRYLVDRDGDGQTDDKDCNDGDQRIFTGARELCDGVDNDCDGKIDIGCACIVGAKRSCATSPRCKQISPGNYKCTGRCRSGTQTCIAGKWGPCTGEVKPSAEVCDNEDNDCDGQVDENTFRRCTGPNGSQNVGQCQDGYAVCSRGKWGSCESVITPFPELCDGLDNDCDGTVDENLQRKCYSGPPSTEGKSACKAGQQTCRQGLWGKCQGEVAPQNEVCNGKDDDCDGLVDNQGGGVDPIRRDCTTSCGKGKETCTNGSWTGCTAPTTCETPTENVPDKEPAPDRSEPVSDKKEPGLEERIIDGKELVTDSQEPQLPDGGEVVTDGPGDDRRIHDGAINDGRESIGDRGESTAPDRSESTPELGEPSDSKEPKPPENTSDSPENPGTPETPGDSSSEKVGDGDSPESGEPSETPEREMREDYDLRMTGGCGCQLPGQTPMLPWLLFLFVGLPLLCLRR